MGKQIWWFFTAFCNCKQVFKTQKQLPYSVKLPREKTLRISQFCGYLQKCSPWKSYFSSIRESFLPRKLSAITVHCMGVYQTAVLSEETFVDTGILEWKLIRTWMAGTYHKCNIIWHYRIFFVVRKVIHTDIICILPSFPDFPTL